MLNSLSLAFLGDAVFGLLVREKLVCEANRPVGELHNASVHYVCAAAQSQAVELLLDELTEEETAVYKRGRNHGSNHTPKHSDIQEYRRATGLECLFGYLYLKQENARLRTLFNIIWDNIE